MPIINFRTTSIRWLVAELLVVIIGILIALQVDSWNSYNDEREMERNALIGIVENLRDDIERLDQVIARRQHQSESLSSLILALQSPIPVSGQNLAQYWVDSIFGTLWAPTATTYIGLRESGQIYLIEDQQLRDEIVRYYELGHPFIASRDQAISDALDKATAALLEDIHRVVVREATPEREIVLVKNVPGEEWAYSIHVPLEEIPRNKRFIAEANEAAFYLQEFHVRVAGVHTLAKELEESISEILANR